MKMRLVMFSGLFAFLSGGPLLAGCSADDEIKSTCVPGEACEIYMLRTCGCCAADEIQPCKDDKSGACATGRLGLNLSAEECADNNQKWEQLEGQGSNPCTAVAPASLEQTCKEKLLGSGG